MGRRSDAPLSPVGLGWATVPAGIACSIRRDVRRNACGQAPLTKRARHPIHRQVCHPTLVPRERTADCDRRSRLVRNGKPVLWHTHRIPACVLLLACWAAQRISILHHQIRCAFKACSDTNVCARRMRVPKSIIELHEDCKRIHVWVHMRCLDEDRMRDSRPSLLCERELWQYANASVTRIAVYQPTSRNQH